MRRALAAVVALAALSALSGLSSRAAAASGSEQARELYTRLRVDAAPSGRDPRPRPVTETPLSLAQSARRDPRFVPIA